MPRLTANREYCSIARALELLGERWTLHIVRDLLSGPKRFGELERLVVGITPKWLTARLRALEAAGLVAKDGRLYRLTGEGEALRPVLEELLVWSTVHDSRPPRLGETIVPEHDMWALEVLLNRVRPAVDGPVRWAVDLGDAGSHVLAYDGQRWDWMRDEREGDVVIATTARRWAELLFAIQTGAASTPGHYRLSGDPERVEEFRRLARLSRGSEVDV